MLQIANYNYLPSSNIPYVNDSSTCQLQVNVTNSNGTAIQHAAITGVFNSSSMVSDGVELYPITGNPSDKGLYNITMDTTGLNSTFYPQFANYTIFITLSALNYTPSTVNISTNILPIPSQIIGNAINSTYESSSIVSLRPIYRNFKSE